MKGAVENPHTGATAWIGSVAIAMALWVGPISACRMGGSVGIGYLLYLRDQSRLYAIIGTQMIPMAVAAKG
jgi:hypothetical protein